MTRTEELEKILESGCDGNCENCKVKKECEELARLHEQETKEKNEGFEEGQFYQNDDSNIFIKRVRSGTVKFIEGVSPSAIHDMQELPAWSLRDYMNRWGFRLAEWNFETFA